ncbi:MAG: hypothetical protein ABI353_02865 [Isosphaeraceae bacterium]
MVRSTRFIQALVMAWAVASAHGQAGLDPEFKVVYWYDRADPVGSFKSRAYDLRKHEYDDPKVDAWLAMMARDFPRFAAYSRTVDLDRLPGRTDQEKLTAASTRELQPLIDSALSALRIQNRPIGRSKFGLKPFEPVFPSPIGAARFPSRYAPPRYSSPVPYPYPRPHP